MREDVIERLLHLNREFYQRHAASFAESRPNLQPGVQRILPQVAPEASVFEAGCGFGGVAAALHAAGHLGRYLGVDSSRELLLRARAWERPPRVTFEEVDLAAVSLWQQIPGEMDWVLAFAILHHLPGEVIRQRVVQGMAACLKLGGRAAVSVWTFLNSPRLRQRLLAWQAVGLTADEVEPGDYLLDWRRGAHGIRYVHAFDPSDLQRLAESAGLTVVESFASDGEAGKLGWYQVWEKREAPARFDDPQPAW